MRKIMKPVSKSIYSKTFVTFMWAIVCLSCDKPLIADVDMAEIEILGKEICHEDREVWVISLSRVNSSKNYGSEIYYNNKNYTNVVKTYYDLSEYYEDTVNNYSVEFNEINATEPECTLNDSLPISLNTIHIKNVRVSI